MPATPFKRLTSALVLLTFTSLTLQPLQAVAQVKLAQNQSSQTAPQSDDEQAAKLLDGIRDTAKRGADKARQGHKTRDDAQTLRQQARQLEALETKVDDAFAATEADLIAKRLPPEILTRHRAAVAEVKARQTEFKRQLKTLETADDQDDEIGRSRSVTELSTWLEQNHKSRPYTQTDPRKLPFRTPEGKVRPPVETREGYQAKQALFGIQPIRLAGAIPTGGLNLGQSLAVNTPPDAADLAETEDIQLTPAIRAKAQELGHHPVTIHNWVRNSIEYLPTYGSIQGADLTLQTKRGNAIDTASLEIALLRAANIPARYVYGTVQLPIAQAMNWLGGVTHPEAALNLLGQGGIPSIGLVTGGQISAIKMEHVWVEAWVQYIPSRGAVHRTGQGDTWIPLDPSQKQYAYAQGMDIQSAVPLDANALLTQAKSGATLNETEGWVQNLNSANLQTALTNYQTQVKQYIDNQKPDATVGDVLGSKTIVQKHYRILLGTLPYQTPAIVGARMAALPDSFRHKFQFDLYASDYDKALGSPSFSYQQSLVSLAGKRIALAYEAASPSDQAVLDDARDNYRTSLPAYLIRMKPVLKIEGQTVATGAIVTMGSGQLFTVTTTSPWYGFERDYKVTAGDLSVLGINPAGITPEAFDARTTQHDLSGGNDPDFTAEMFNQIMLGWWAEKYAFNDIISTVNRVIHYQLPSHGLAAAPLTVRYFFGIARSASYQSRTLDAKQDLVIAEHAESDNEHKRRFMLAAGQVGSYLEAGIYDQAFLMEPGHSMSTITALKAANDQGIPIYSIDQSNAAMLNRIATAPEDLEDMRNAVAAGLRVTAPAQDITVDNFSGMGYILEDPLSGAASYMVSGGRNGDNSPTGQSVYPMPQPVATPIHNLMLRSTLRNAKAGLVGQDGIVMGIALTAVAPVAGAAAPKNPYALAIMAVIVALIIYSSHVKQIEDRYPRTSRVLRHFTKATFAALIDASKFVLASKPGGTFNKDFPAVYFADVADETAKASCPPTAAQSDNITRNYELGTEPPDTPLTRVSGYVDVEITRAGYWDSVMDEGINSHNTREVIFKLPFLYFGPYAVAIRGLGACY